MRTPAQAAIAAFRLPNRWDILVMPIVFGVLFLLAWGSRQMAVPYEFGQPLPLSLDPALLPVYALRNDLLDLWIKHLIPTQAILMVSHSIEEVLMMADRIIILDSNPGRLKQELPVTLKHPRDHIAPAFRQMVDRIYEIMTSVATGGGAPKATGIGYRLPDANVQQLLGVLAVMIDWGRYAELFAYDYDTGVFNTENPGEEESE